MEFLKAEKMVRYRNIIIDKIVVMSYMF